VAKKHKDKPLKINMPEDEALRLMLNTALPSHLKRSKRSTDNPPAPKRKKKAAKKKRKSS
jgi:hypothetical protein